MEFMFRNLTADEIEVRVNDVREWGVTLLLYKDARCDMNILDETVGAENWQRRHEVIDGVLYCSVGIFCAQRGWVWKQDAGTAGNFEKEKSKASDSFKRACTNWGIGRELYTSPRIQVGQQLANIRHNNNGKPVCYDEFSVAKVIVEQHVIKCIAIRNDTTGRIVFTWIRPGYTPQKAVEIEGDGAPVSVPVFEENYEEGMEDF